MKERTGKFLKSVHHYTVFFLLMAFVITCCMMLFIRVMSHTMNITLTEENINIAAKLTFANVVLLSLLCTVIDGARRKITVSRPVKKITDAAQKIMEGDFTVRIPPVQKTDYEDSLNQIINCFNKMAQELSGTETLRTDFIANVSHELKTPLAVMQNYGTLLQQPDLPEEKRMEYAKSITDASRRLADLISNILKLNKLKISRSSRKPPPMIWVSSFVNVFWALKSFGSKKVWKFKQTLKTMSLSLPTGI